MKNIDKLQSISLKCKVYLSIDLDVFDPVYAPGVSHLEPGGLMPRTIFDFLHNMDVPIIGADIVEFNPKNDVNGLTAALSAKLLKELLGKIGSQLINEQ